MGSVRAFKLCEPVGELVYCSALIPDLVLKRAHAAPVVVLFDVFDSVDLDNLVTHECVALDFDNRNVCLDGRRRVTCVVRD